MTVQLINQRRNCEGRKNAASYLNLADCQVDASMNQFQMPKTNYYICQQNILLAYNNLEYQQIPIKTKFEGSSTKYLGGKRRSDQLCTAEIYTRSRDRK